MRRQSRDDDWSARRTHILGPALSIELVSVSHFSAPVHSQQSMPAQQPAQGMGRLLGVLTLLTALLSSMVYLMEQNLDRFYIFELDHLEDLSKRALAQHGNDTRSVVQYIVTELSDKHGPHVNLEEEWMFNNAGGAMGAMYIIHASECCGNCQQVYVSCEILTWIQASPSTSSYLVSRLRPSCALFSTPRTHN